jgi:alpha-galactosidase
MQKQTSRDVPTHHSLYRYVLPVLLIFIFSSALTFVATHNVRASAALPQENNGLAQTPLMGWSSWSSIRSNPTEATIKAQAQALANTLKSYGYSYINLDDFWYLNPTTSVDQYGRWNVDTSRFPDGMAATANYVHSLGLKFGIYLTPGIPVAAVRQNTPIQGTSYHAADIADTSRYETNYNFGNNAMYYINYSKPGAQAFINSWADELASWGVDFLKIDGVGDWDIPDIQAWSTALRQSGRPIYFSLSNSLDVNNVSIWQQNANGWRISGDVECYCSTLVTWNSVSSRFSIAPRWVGDGGPGGWNDLDSLDVGNGARDGLTNDERQSYMTLWAIESAPLSIGDNLTSLDSYGLSLLTNSEVIAVDQAGHQAHPISQASSQQVWFANNGDGSYTVALFNLGGSTATVSVNWSSLGFSGAASVRDLWSHTNLGTVTNSFSATLNTHASRLLKVTPGSVATPTPTPTHTPTSTPTPASTPSPTPSVGTTPTAGTTPTPISGASCSVQYTITNQWPGGFGANVVITNTGSTAINGWTLSWSFANGQTITQLWNGSYTQSGSTVSVTNASYNGAIAAGGNTNFGFNGTWNGSNAAPTAFSLNGTACTVA